MLERDSGTHLLDHAWGHHHLQCPLHVAAAHHPLPPRNVPDDFGRPFVDLQPDANRIAGLHENGSLNGHYFASFIFFGHHILVIPRTSCTYLLFVKRRIPGVLAAWRQRLAVVVSGVTRFFIELQVHGCYLTKSSIIVFSQKKIKKAVFLDENRTVFTCRSQTVRH